MAVCNPEICLEKNSTGLTPWNFDPACSVCHSLLISYPSLSTRSSDQLVIFYLFKHNFLIKLFVPREPRMDSIIHLTFFKVVYISSFVCHMQAVVSMRKKFD